MTDAQMLEGGRPEGSGAPHPLSRGVPPRPTLEFGKATPLLLFAIAILLTDWLLFVRSGQGYLFWGGIDGRPYSREMLFCLRTLLLMGVGLALSPAIAPIRQPRAALALVAGLGVLAAIAVGWLALGSFANSGDEYAYRFQGLTFAAGRLWNAPPPLGNAMSPFWIWVADGKWASQYPPGWPALLAMADVAHLPGWFVNTALSVAGTILLHDLVRSRAGGGAALLAAALFALSPFTIFNAASGFSHMLAAVLILGIVWNWERAGTGRLGWALATGAALGMLGITRPVSAAIVAVALAPAVVGSRRPWMRAAAIVAGGLPFLIGLLWYQRAITGDPLKPVYYFGGRSADHLYFDTASIRAGLQLTLSRWSDLTLWTSPVVPLLWVATAIGKAVRGRFGAADAIFPLGVLVFVFYPLPAGNEYGPRYYFDYWPMLLFTVATGLSSLPSVAPPRAATLGWLSVCYGLILCPFLGSDYHRIVLDRNDLYRAAAQAGLSRAVVCVDATTGPMLPLLRKDLIRNDVDAGAPVLYALCSTGNAAALRAAYPQRTIWHYRRDPYSAAGTLTRERAGPRD